MAGGAKKKWGCGEGEKRNRGGEGEKKWGEKKGRGEKKKKWGRKKLGERVVNE